MTRCTFCDQENPAGANTCSNCRAELLRSPETETPPLDEGLSDLIKSGQKIRAVKVYRERTGCGLKEAVDAIETLQRGETESAPNADATSLDPDVLSLLRQGKKIQAIKLYRDKTRAGLAESKAAVEALGKEHGIQAQASGCAGVLLIFVVLALFVVQVGIWR
jgi:ribosomal protein L7/L12